DITSVVKKPTLIEPETEYKEMMKDYIAVHSRSGLITAYGKKYLLTNKPYISESELFIPLDETADFLGVSYSTATSSDGYVRASEFFENDMNLTVSEFASEYNGGVMIAGSDAFDEKSVSDIQALNDYLYNYRPTADEIQSMYNSSALKGQHPRIYVSASDVERIKRECETNEYMKNWKENIIAACKWISTLPIVEYEIDDGNRLLGVSRKVLSYMHTYGMAYLLTGDASYAQKAFLHLEAAANFPDWNPDHALDTGEMAAAFAVGYDWMYHGFTEDQRKIIEDGFYRLGIAAANNLYENVAGRTSSVVCDINWNAVVNGGIATGAFAFMDVYPQNTSAIVANAINGYSELLWRFAPYGAWFEGPGYWEYTIKYTTKMLSNSMRILGTDFGLLSCEGFDTTVDYILHMQSLNGPYAYGDCMTTSVFYVPEIFWLSKALNKPEYMSTLLKLKEGIFSDYEDIALALCWYDTSVLADDVHVDLDAWIGGEDVVAMRSGWTKDDSYFAASAGFTGDNHCHLDSGSYVFDLNGVRWAYDLGQGNYNNPTYSYTNGVAGGERWKIFRLRAEAHNTVFINPTTNEDHKIDSNTYIDRFETNDTSGITVMDLSENLADNANSAKRAFAYCNNRSALVIRDEIDLSDKSKSNDIYWALMTKADVEILSDGTGAILTQDGKTLYLRFVCSGADTSNITVAPAAPLDTTGVVVSEAGDDSYNRILIKLTSSDKADLTVSLSAEDGTELLNRYNTALSGWTLE
ncbi:MAG: heparinase II/III family protein, partial [Clostridia bacterium]|nr:heparinase II/III family protein [Clostridia bacterium]